jgi:hypothetical protein
MTAKGEVEEELAAVTAQCTAHLEAIAALKASVSENNREIETMSVREIKAAEDMRTLEAKV